MFWDLRISYFFERKVIFLETGNQFLGTERVSKLMRQYAIPCIISLLVGALYNIVDQIFIANASYLGSYGNASNTVVFPLTVVALAIAVMVGDGCCAFVSMALGRNEVDKAKRSVGNAVVLSVASSLALTAVYLLFADSIIAMFGGTVNEETFRHSQEYFFYITLGIPFYMFGQAMNPIIRADGNPKFAMARSTAGTQLPPVYVYAVETAIQMTLTELNENLREIYIEAYTQQAASDYIFRETAKELYQIFGRYQPELTERDFYAMEIGSSGIMRGYMAHPCDEELTLEKKLRMFLTMSLRAYHVPEDEIEKTIGFIEGLNIREISERVMQELFKALAMHFEFSLSGIMEMEK